jgi:type IV secretory pathway VirJ component
MKLLCTGRLTRLLSTRLLVASFWLAGAVHAATPPAAAASPASSASGPARLTHGRFRDFPVYQPSGTPTGFVLLLSGDDGWTATTDTMARQLAERGAMVAGIDWRKFKANLEADGDQCLFPDGDLENLSHFVQAYFHSPAYLSPILVGIYSGAAMAYAMLAQAPRDTFAAAMTLSFCPDLDLGKPLCKGSGLEFKRSNHGVDLLPVKSLGNPWVNLEDEAHRSCPAGTAKQFIAPIRGAATVTLPAVGAPQYTAAYSKLAAQNLSAHAAPLPAALSDLPVVEVPAQPGSASNVFAILMSGDGGWAGLDQDVAAALSARGIAVVGLDSLRYFWTARTPAGLATDTDRLIRYYGTQLGKQRVLLIGYSQGADVLPFAVNRLPEATRARVALTAVMGMSEHALFEFHVSSWISDSSAGPATLPEINRITGMPVLCIYGADESDSLCPKLDPGRFRIVKLKGGHHFDGDYAGLAQQILDAVKPSNAP